MTLRSTAEQGNRLETLRVLRDSIAADIDACESLRDKATLSQRLMDALVQIEALEADQPATKGTVLDEVSTRRAAKSSPGPSRRRL